MVIGGFTFGKLESVFAAFAAGSRRRPTDARPGVFACD
jgi:hypothetical protein